MTYAEAMEKAKRDYLEAVYRACDGNVSKAARESGLNRTFLQKILVRYGVKPPGRSPKQRGNEEWERLGA